MRKFLSVLIFFLFATPAEGAYLDLAWDPNTEPDLAGYRIYYGTASGQYTHFIDVGNVTTYRLDGLLDGVRYYVAATAYDTSQNESDYSNEASGMGVIGNNGDTDGDGLPDNWEMTYFGNLDQGSNDDDDSDELNNVGEYEGGTDPTNSDTDSDQMPDGWEIQYGLNPLDSSDASQDGDGDGVTNLDEYLTGTDPWNAPPTASAGPDQTVTEGVMVHLDGSNSSDPDDGIASYLWEQTAGISVILSDPIAVKPTFIAPDVDQGGTSLTFRLKVTDNGGLESTDSCVVNVSWGNAPPAADAGSDQTVNEGVTVVLNGSNSSDPDDGIASYHWEQTAGIPVFLSNPNEVRPTFAAPNVGPGGASLTFRLTVTDQGRLQSTDSCVVNISWVNIPPMADAGSDQAVDEGVTVRLNGSNSLDPDDGVGSYLWEQTSGIPVTFSDPTAATPTFVTPPVDTGEVRLSFQVTVTDTGGLRDSDEVSVNIEDNGITGFPPDAITFKTPTNENMGLRVDSGGSCVSLKPVDPSMISDGRNRPKKIIYGMVDIEIKPESVGGTAFVTFYFPEPVPHSYKLYKYAPSSGWKNYNRYTDFNSARDQVTLTLVDGGIGDDDGFADGMILDPSGVGTDPSSSGSSSAEDYSGCFISTLSLPCFGK